MPQQAAIIKDGEIIKSTIVCAGDLINIQNRLEAQYPEYTVILCNEEDSEFINAEPTGF